MFEIIKNLLIAASVTFSTFLIILTLIYIKSTLIDRLRIDRQLTKLNKIPLPTYNTFIIKNPYKYDGNYYKVQLHSHTNRSDGKLSPPETTLEYKRKEYNFLAITDHDKVTKYNSENDTNFMTITGEEVTSGKPFWPLGEHIGCLFVRKHTKKGSIQSRINQITKNGGIVIINHPSCIFNLGTQQWLPRKLIKLKNFNLIEIVNHYSSTDKNLLYWHGLLKHFGPETPIWGTGGDDSHSKGRIDTDFIMVKMEILEKSSLKKALIRGSFYITQGPIVNFDYCSDYIYVNSVKDIDIKFIDADFNILYNTVNKKARYKPKGNEGFIRIEVENLDNNKKAWSQPFWIIKKDRTR